MAIDSLPSTSVTTTGLRVTPSVERIATWGWLMIGSTRWVPNEPVFVMRERAAGDVVGRQLLGAGPVGEVVDLAGDGPQPLVVGVVHDRGEQALEVEVDGDRPG